MFGVSDRQWYEILVVIKPYIDALHCKVRMTAALTLQIAELSVSLVNKTDSIWTSKNQTSFLQSEVPDSSDWLDRSL